MFKIWPPAAASSFHSEKIVNLTIVSFPHPRLVAVFGQRCFLTTGWGHELAIADSPCFPLYLQVLVTFRCFRNAFAGTGHNRCTIGVMSEGGVVFCLSQDSAVEEFHLMLLHRPGRVEYDVAGVDIFVVLLSSFRFGPDTGVIGVKCGILSQICTV